MCDKIEINVKNLKTIEIACNISADIPSKGRFKIEDKRISKDRMFKLDTGSTHTCMNAADLGIFISEDDFNRWHTVEKITAGGIDDDIKIAFYKLQVENFKIGNLDLGSVPIYVTFYEKMTKALLGMNILRLLNISISGDENKVILQKTNKLINYKEKHLRVERPELLESEQYEDPK